MKVKELIKILETLDQDREIKYDSYEFIGDFKIDRVEEKEYDGHKYYNIVGDE
ncbi:hypothetical protein [Clostridium sp. Cult2]|uniref:hypothetical protein n=1 Tax=Clostridium sp. Cult2 TaxID=2079003 RepID=UPI001F449D78|nr:hypothetical protein [Clostridium sp. Cult2]